jgi:hypothetical protein
METSKDLTTLVPHGMLKRLRDHFAEKIDDAVRSYRFNHADED